MRFRLLSAALAFAAAGCATMPDRSAESSVEQAIPHDLNEGQARLAARLYPHLANSAEANANLFISPLSLSEGLGLALAGARGQTKTELRTLTGWDGQGRPESLVRDYDRFLMQTDDSKVALSVANALWLSDRLQFSLAYLRSARNDFGATAQRVAFGANPSGAAETINRWVSEQTRKRITRIADPAGFNDTTASVLTNALWFEADWSVPFEHGAIGEFTRGDGSRKLIWMMERVAPLAYRESSDGQAVQLPYGTSGRFTMEVFLPKDMGTLRRWERNLNSLSFNLATQGSDGKFDLGATKEQTILLRLPRFEARFDDSVKAALISAGAPCAFAEGCADFFGMADAPLKIDDVAHATFLRVDEQGTKAAAVTAVKIVVTASRQLPDNLPQMIVNRPFLLTIRDRASGALIFFGRIADPTLVEKPE